MSATALACAPERLWPPHKQQADEPARLRSERYTVRVSLSSFQNLKVTCDGPRNFYSWNDSHFDLPHLTPWNEAPISSVLQQATRSRPAIHSVKLRQSLPYGHSVTGRDCKYLPMSVAPVQIYTPVSRQDTKPKELRRACHIRTQTAPDLTLTQEDAQFAPRWWQHCQHSCDVAVENMKAGCAVFAVNGSALE
jgi:hypothetical protein